MLRVSTRPLEPALTPCAPVFGAARMPMMVYRFTYMTHRRPWFQLHSALLTARQRVQQVDFIAPQQAELSWTPQALARLCLHNQKCRHIMACLPVQLQSSLDALCQILCALQCHVSTRSPASRSGEGMIMLCSAARRTSLPVRWVR